MTAPQRIGVFGVGNALMGDDGIGPFVVKILESRYEFPTNVAPGDVRQYRKPQLVSVPIPQRVSPHDPALAQ
jgi:Ni,Fe-hydrogenase maturation factor